MKRTFSLWLGLRAAACLPAAAGLLAFSFLPVLAQTPAPPPGTIGHIHGHVTNPVGTATTSGTVSLSTDGGHTAKFSFPVDANGDYKGDATPGSYTLVYRAPDTPPDKMVDSFEHVKVIADQDTLQDVDMSRKEYIDKLDPDQKKQLEELKAKNAVALKANEVIKNLNADLRTVTQDVKDADSAAANAAQQLGDKAAKADIDAKAAEIKTAKYTEIETLMLKDSAAKPDASVLWAQLGLAQTGLKKYDEAEATFKKVLEIESTSKKPQPPVQGLANSGLGEIYARTGKVPEANAAYDAAGKANPTQAVFYLTNEAKIFYQTHNPDAQIAAADEAIKTDTNPNDPALAIDYYLKANGLVPKTTMDPKTNKLIAPEGCIEAYQKYIDLAPNGPYVGEVKDILAGFGQKITTTYKADTKKKN
ncbi:MAG: tetratricopeptide repeat protein [Terracidiphilus sp.]|jgi:tetratricopeptide (TPR) repeat protein